MQKMHHKLRGFTLIEMLIVVFIISLLSAISIGYYTEQQKVSRDAQRKSDIVKISGVLKNYFSVYKVYPLATQHKSSTTNDVGNCFYFSDGGVNRLGATIPSDLCTVSNATADNQSSFPNNYYKTWIPGLNPSYLPNLPVDPKFKLTGGIAPVDDFKSCTNQLISKDYPTISHQYYQGCNKNYWAYFYTSRLYKIEDSTNFKPQKFFILGAALENTDDKSTIGVTNQKIFNLNETYNGNNKITNPIPNATIVHGMPDNLYIVTSE